MSDQRSAADGGRTVDGVGAEGAAESRAIADVPALGRVLVTGGGGFIGSHVVRALVRQNDVRVVDTFDRGEVGRLPAEVTAVEGDVRNRTLVSELLCNVDVVVHLAGQISVEQSFEQPMESHSTNVEATVQLLELARRHDARVVFASSAAIYGEPESVPVHESDPKRPESPYGVEKLAADQYVRLYGDRYDLPVVPLRFFNVYGPGASGGVVDAFVRRALAGEPLTVHGEGDQTRDFVHVSDVVRATLAAAETASTGRAYNVGTGRRHSVEELARIVDRQVDGGVEIEYDDPRPGDISHSGASIERARSRLDYEPRVDLSEGVASLVDAMADRA